MQRLSIALGTALQESGQHTFDLNDIVRESIAIHPHASDHFPNLLARHGVADPKLHQDARDSCHANRFFGLKLFPEALTTIRTLRTSPTVSGIGLVTNGPSS